MEITKQTHRNGTYRIWIDGMPAGHGFAFNNVYVDFDAQGNSTGGTFVKGSDGEAAALWLITKHKESI